MTMTLDGTNGVTFFDTSLQGAAASPYVLKNRIINGDMRIDQRNAGASVTPTVTNTYTLDRWNEELTQASKFSIQQNAAAVTPPTEFNYYLGVTSLSSYSILSTDFFTIEQRIEGYNVADLAWGTANAKTITLSFWVRSSLTGTFGGALSNGAYNRSYPFTYTISTANTWTQISVTIAGDTSGTWLTTNGIGMYVFFGLGAGSTQSQTAGVWVGVGCVSATGATSVVGTNAATWYVTGVQLEVGSTATPFERRLYNQELANCQRYLPATTAIGGAGEQAGLVTWIGATTAWGIFIPIVQPRVVPTGLTATATQITARVPAGSNLVCTAVAFAGGGLNQFLFDITVAAGGAANASGWYFLNTTGAKILWTGCEL